MDILGPAAFTAGRGRKESRLSDSILITSPSLLFSSIDLEVVTTNEPKSVGRTVGNGPFPRRRLPPSFDSVAAVAVVVSGHAVKRLHSDSMEFLAPSRPDGRCKGSRRRRSGRSAGRFARPAFGWGGATLNICVRPSALPLCQLNSSFVRSSPFYGARRNQARSMARSLARCTSYNSSGSSCTDICTVEWESLSAVGFVPPA